MKKTLLKFILVLSLIVLPLFTHAEWWAKNAPQSLVTNDGSGLANADIHVRNCYIGLGTATPCGGGSSAVTGSGAANRITFWTGAQTVSSDTNFQFNSTNDTLVLGGAATTSPGSGTRIFSPNGAIANTNYGMVSLGGGGFAGGASGFSGSNQGTFYAINSALGFAGSFFDYQVDGNLIARLLANGDFIVNDSAGNGTLLIDNSAGDFKFGDIQGSDSGMHLNLSNAGSGSASIQDNDLTYLSIDPSTSLFKFGDTLNNANGTKIVVDDLNEIISFQNILNNNILFATSSFFVSLGDVDGVGTGSTLSVASALNRAYFNNNTNNISLGINTTTPGDTLDVRGTVNVGGTINTGAGSDFYVTDINPTASATANNQEVALLRLRNRGNNGGFTGTHLLDIINENPTGSSHTFQLFSDSGRIRSGFSLVSDPTTAQIEVLSNASDAVRGIMSTQYTTDSISARYLLRKARGTDGSLTTVVSGDNLGSIMGEGYDGSNFLQMSNITMGTEGTVAATRIPTFMSFSTATNAAPSVLTEAMRIGSNQNVAIGTTTTTGAKTTIAAGNITSGTAALLVSGILPSSGDNQAVKLNITSSGTAVAQAALMVNLIAGYSGSGITIGTEVDNFATSTGNNLQFTTTATNITGNSGFNTFVGGTTTGLNVGGKSEAYNGNVNVGLYGKAATLKNGATNIGILGIGRNTGTTPIQIGGFFSLANTTPTFESSALIADNADQTSPIFLGKDNGTTVFSIADGGTITSSAGKLSLCTSTSGAGTLSLGNCVNYSFTGTTTTWSLPSIAGNTGVEYRIKNRGSGDITLNVTGGGAEIYDTAAVTSITVTPGSAYTLINDGTYWLVE